MTGPDRDATLPMVRSRLLVACLAGALSGCATAKAPIVTPAPAPPPAPVVEAPPPPPPPQPPAPPPPDRIDLVIAQAEKEFEAGRVEFDRRRIVAAREHFDRAIDVLLQSPEGAKGEARLQSAFDRLLDRISALDVLALREADGFAEARTEPAAIDELLNAAMFIERPQPKATTSETVAADLEHSPSDVRIDINDRVLAYVELFQGRLRDFLQAGLDRGQRYLPMIQSVFKSEGLPLDLAYVPLIESAFKTTALSRVSARGIRSRPVLSPPHQGQVFIRSSTPRPQWGQVPSNNASSFHCCGRLHQGQYCMGYWTPPPQPQSHRASLRKPRGALSGSSLE